MSRGIVIPKLLRHARLDRAVDAAFGLDLSRFLPFRLVALQHEEAAVLTVGDTTPRLARCRLHRPLMFTSSSLGDSLVRAPRGRLFQRVVVANGAPWLEAQALFHQHQWPGRPELSVRMTRADARTVSRSTVDVTTTGICFKYEPFGTEAGERR